jgi:hypothetical protein
MAAPDAAKALYGDAGGADSELPRSPGGGPALLALPPPETNSGAPLARSLAARRSERDFAAAGGAVPLALADVAQLLWAAQGVTAQPSSPAAPPLGRTAPSAGALFPLQVFLVVGDNTVQARACALRRRPARAPSTNERRAAGVRCPSLLCPRMRGRWRARY